MLAVARELDEAKKSSAEFEAERKETGEAAEGGIFARMTEGLAGALAPITAIKANLGEMVELVAAAFAVETIADWISETTGAAEKLRGTLPRPRREHRPSRRPTRRSARTRPSRKHSSS